MIIDREEWGAREPTNVTTVDPDDRTGIAIHHAVTPTDRSVKWIQDFHMDSRDWADIGYNFLVREGEIYEGRGWDVKGAHAAPHNTTHVGICWVGDARYDELLEEDEEALIWLILEAEERFGRQLSVDGHGSLPGQSTDCPGDFLRDWLVGMPWRDSTPMSTVTFDIKPRPANASLNGSLLTLTFGSTEPKPAPKPAPEPSPEPDVPTRPADGMFQPGQVHPSFKLMGGRFLDWLRPNEIAHDGDGYQAGAMYSEWDDFNVRKVQALMSNPADPVGKAYLGPKQWNRLFTEDRPNNSELPAELRGSVPPQLHEPEKTEPKPAPNKVPPVPKPSEFQPGHKAPWVTLMGERFLKWLKPDEIHYAGSAYEPGPRYSLYDDRNVRVIQALMGNVPDLEGEEFLGPKQWERLFTEDRPKNAKVPDELKPGGKSKTSDPSPSGDIPADGRRITQHYGVPGNYTAGIHTGVDFGDSGSDVIRSVGAGTVVSAGSAGAYGLRVVVKHANGRYSHYAHLRQVNVGKGQKVTRGQNLGLMGNTGNSTGKHLHYQESAGGWDYWDYKRPIMLGFGGY